MADYRWIKTDGRFDIAQNWANTTLRIDPARIPPGINDTATFFSGGGTISGVGSVGGLVIHVGNLSPWLISGQIQSITSVLNGAAELIAGGSWNGGAATFGSGGAFVVDSDALFRATSVVLTPGATLAVQGSGVAVVGSGNGAPGVLTVDGSLSGAGSITAAGGIVNNGVMTATDGTLSLGSAVSGSGVLRIGPGATLAIGGTSTVPIEFGGPGASLQVATVLSGTTAGLSEQAAISGFAPGNTILYAGSTPVTDVAYSPSGPGVGTLTLLSGGTVLGTLTLLGDYSNDTFGVTPLGIDVAAAGGITACFASGTRIRTLRGDVAVEELREGDTVQCAGGGTAPVVWLGHRRVDCRRHPRPQDVLPVRVQRHAFGTDAPCRDLLLSPDHAVFMAGRLVPVRYLVNGATITQVAVDRITYWHVELPAHDVLLAENLACESYLDTGNRHAFAGVLAEMRAPEFDAVAYARATWSAKACAKLLTNGPELATLRAGLLDRVVQLGHRITADAGLHLSADGVILLPSVVGRVHHFTVPVGLSDLQIRSRSVVPAAFQAQHSDHRRLGVAVAAIVADGESVPLDDPRLSSGWHDAEPGWRWTDGCASLPAARSVIITLAMTTQYHESTPSCTEAPVRGAMSG